MAELLKYRKRNIIHILAWIVLLLVYTIFEYSEGRSITQNLVYRVAIGAAVFYVNYSALVPNLLLKKKNAFYLLSLILLVGVTYLTITAVFPIETNNNQELSKSRFMAIVIFNLVLIVIGTIIRVYEQWIENDKIKTEIVAQKNKTELEALKNQLNPHFLFNSLNSIYSLTVKKSNDAPEAVIMLSILMRYMLYKANDDEVLLKDELLYIENYIKLQRIRISKNEKVKTNISGTISAQKISPLLFISYIENAFKYGTDLNGNTEVIIDIRVNDYELQFKCVNVIGSRNRDDENSGIGMQNTKERLELLYPDKHLLNVREKDNTFIVDLKLKLN